ncbi:MAG: ribonuclease P protein component [Streptococcaceae bacterium]|nr:ribonuclease P protein component [Streptococcaceae bacterium]
MRKEFRVKKDSDFTKILQNKSSFANRNFICYHLQNPENKHFRVGISVGKKVSKRAVDRNSVKRKIRESLFELKDEIREDEDFIIIARPTALDLKTIEVKKNILHLLKNVGVLKEKK